MGWPLLIAGLAAAGAGTGAQMAASKDEESAMNKAVEAELNRQQGYRQKSQAAVQKNVAENTPVASKATMDQGVKQALADYSNYMTQAAASAPASAPSTSSYLAPSDTQKGANEKSNEAAANLQGWANLGLTQNLNNAKTNSLLGQYANFAGGSRNVLPIEMTAAQNSAEGLRGIGQISSLLGSLAMMGGGLGIGAGSAAASASAQNAAQAAAMGAGSIPGTFMNRRPMYSAPQPLV